MRIPRFYQEGEIRLNQDLELSATNHRHAIQVLRLKVGEDLILFNGNGGEFHAKVIVAEKRASKVLIESFDAVNRESPLKIILALALIKPDKMDFAIQKAVELGVSCIQPVVTKRSVINMKAKRLEKKMQHWQGIIIAACEQSGRTSLPQINQAISLEQYLKTETIPCIAMLPGDHPQLINLDLNAPKNISLLIGPEGGFTEDEEEMMLTNVNAISFGCRILRAETAAIAGLTALQQRWGDL